MTATGRKFKVSEVFMSYEQNRVRLAFPDTLEPEMRIGFDAWGLPWTDPDRTLQHHDLAGTICVASVSCSNPPMLGRLLVETISSAGIYQHHQHVFSTNWGSTRIFLDVD